MSVKDLGVISSESCRERLDLNVLASVGLIADEGMMGKKEIRMRTGLLCVSNNGSEALETKLTSFHPIAINKTSLIFCGNNLKVTVNLSSSSQVAWVLLILLLTVHRRKPTKTFMLAQIMSGAKSSVS